MVKKKIVLLTGDENRHLYFHNFLIKNKIKLVRTFCENSKNDIKNRIGKELIKSLVLKNHFKLRKESEKKYFFNFNRQFKKKKIKFINKGEVNNSKIVEKIKKINPDIIICFGCSIIGKELINYFDNKIINLHLGLSPYYRGSGTNVWTLINKEPQLFGATFMILDEGVDTGKIIHQIRARINLNDTPHDIGNRLIKDSAILLLKIINNFDFKVKFRRKKLKILKKRYYKTKDFSENNCKDLYMNFKNGLIKNYLKNKPYLEKAYPIIVNKNFL